MKRYSRLIRANGQYADPTLDKALKSILDEQYGYQNQKINKRSRSYEFQVSDKKRTYDFGYEILLK